MKNLPPALYGFVPRASPYTCTPFCYNGQLLCAFIFVCEPIRIGSCLRSPLKHCARARILMFPHFSAASPGRMFMPSSTHSPGLACAWISIEHTFWAEIVPGNICARVCLSPRALHSTLQHTDSIAACALGTGTHILCLFYLYLFFWDLFILLSMKFWQLSVMSDSSIKQSSLGTGEAWHSRHNHLLKQCNSSHPSSHHMIKHMLQVTLLAT